MTRASQAGVVTTCLLVLNVGAGLAQPARNLQADPADTSGFTADSILGVNGVTLRFRQSLPPSGVAGRPYPLVVWLHGAGGRGKDNQSQLLGDQRAAVDFLTRSRDWRGRPAIVVAPQASNAWHGWSTRPDTMMTLQNELLSVPLLVRSLVRRLPIDTMRIYVVGQSMGGSAAWSLLSREPTLFAAAVLVCPATPGWRQRHDLSQLARVRDIPLWVFEGERDIQAATTRSLIAGLRREGGNPRFTEYAGMGHDIWQRAFAEPELATWLFDQRRR